MSLKEISIEKKEIYNMLYNVGAIFFVTPFILAAVPFFFSALTSTELGFESGVLAISSITMSGFVTMLYTTFKMRKIRAKKLDKQQSEITSAS